MTRWGAARARNGLRWPMSVREPCSCGSRAGLMTRSWSGSSSIRFCRRSAARSVEECARPKTEQVGVCLERTEQGCAVELADVVLAHRHHRVALEHHLERLLEAEHLLLGLKHGPHVSHLAHEPDDVLLFGERSCEEALPFSDGR